MTRKEILTELYKARIRRLTIRKQNATGMDKESARRAVLKDLERKDG